MENHTISEQTSSAYQILSQFHSMIKNKIIPELDRTLREKQPSEKDCAFRDTFIRIFSAVGSLSKLNSRQDFLAAFSLTRIIFEIYIDMHLLEKDIVTDGINKYLNYLKCSKYKKLLGRKNWAEQNHFPFADKFPVHENFLQNPHQKENERTIIQLWGNKFPKHWSDLNLPDRCAKLGSEFIERLIEIYDLGNLSVHPGPLDWNLIKDVEGADIIIGYAYAHSLDMFIDCCKICSDHFNISLASLDKYRHEIENIIMRHNG